MFKNVASQKVRVYAVDVATGGPKTGDAANITVYLSKDRGTLTALTDTSAAEVSSTNAPGAYECDVSQTESNCDIYDVTGVSTTSGVVIVPILNAHTMPANFANRVIDSAGLGDSNVVKAAGVAWGSGAITAAAIAGDAITAAKVATDVGTEIAAAVLTVAQTEAYRADGATGTVVQLLYEIIAHLGESSISGTTKTVHKVDGTTPAATFTLNDGTTPTAITRAS